MATTRSRSHGREHARPSTGGVAAEHATKIYAVAIVGIVITVAFLTLTNIGHVVDAATQHFMLFYAGVVCLMLLCASVAFGLIATDRMFLHPGQRVFIQATHRAASFGAVAFLFIHIITEILAQRVHVLDAFVPFLSPFKTFYIGLGTIAGDILILLAITGIMRGRFNVNGKAWRWRAIHYFSYVAFVFGIWHGLLGGRPAKPYYDWTYGVIVTFALGGLAVRILSNSLRPKENLSGPPVDMAANSASAPMRAAAMFAQIGASRGIGQQKSPMLSMASEPVRSAPVSVARAAAPMLAAPVPAAAPPAAPFYEPGYEGPPRYLGAPRDVGTGPMPRPATGPMALTGGAPMPAGTGSWQQDSVGSTAGWDAGQRPGSATGAQPRLPTGPLPRAGSGPLPRVATGSMPRAATGSFPRTEPGQRLGSATGSQPRLPTGPIPRDARDATTPMDAVGGQQSWQPPRGSATGSFPRADSAGAGTGSWPAAGPATGSQPRLPTGPLPRAGSGPLPRGGSGPLPRGNSGPQPRPGTGPMPRPQTGPMPRPQTGPMPRAGGGTDPYDLGDQGNSGGRGRPRAGGGGGMNNPQVPWDGGLPDPDPDLRYREPGPGMPGYRGSRDHRYGGDVR